MKTCITCREEKPDGEFYSGRNQCRVCRIKAAQEYRKNGPKCLELTDPAAVWATRPMGSSRYWPQMGEWLMGDIDEMPVS